ncbi:hypothetical protein R3W88_004543 [Solanum pinnatisectum]|uniref:Uncharacterized protein n=1 Tax=Solanum pinnatisectum TaxID=50273 RepID=A0AAV9KC05_9SOLN|nr:hypothetical protein R3W88_004543 [Solanum pinnatisectum]
MQSKLASLKIKFLNIAGRTTLAKSSLNSIPTYIMQLAKLPASITKQIDQIQRNFIWGSTEEKKKLYPMSWNLVTRSKQEGKFGCSKVLHEEQGNVSMSRVETI